MSELKNVDSTKFRSDAVTIVDKFGMYKSAIFIIFNWQFPIQMKYIRDNEAPFMFKEFHEAIMKRSRLRSIFLKH